MSHGLKKFENTVSRTERSINDKNLANIVILSESLAEESGISNPDVYICAMIMGGTPLGIGNYYSLT